MRTEIRRVHLQSETFEGGDVRDLAAALKAEEERMANHAGFFSAEEEGATATVVIVTTLSRHGNLAKVEGFENDVAATQRSLAADQEFGICGCQSSEWEERLHDDEALELQSSFSDPISVASTQEQRGLGKEVC